MREKSSEGHGIVGVCFKISVNGSEAVEEKSAILRRDFIQWSLSLAAKMHVK